MSTASPTIFISAGPFVTTVTNKLLKRGLIHKSVDPADRRRVKLQFSDKGDALLAELAPVQRQVNDVQFGCLSKAEFLQLLDMAERLIASSESAVRFPAHLAEDRNQRSSFTRGFDRRERCKLFSSIRGTHPPPGFHNLATLHRFQRSRGLLRQQFGLSNCNRRATLLPSMPKGARVFAAIKRFKRRFAESQNVFTFKAARISGSATGCCLGDRCACVRTQQ